MHSFLVISENIDIPVSCMLLETRLFGLGTRNVLLSYDLKCILEPF